MVKYIPTEKSPKREWMNAERAARLEALGTPEALSRAARLRETDRLLYRMGGFGRWIARKDAEQQAS